MNRKIFDKFIIDLFNYLFFHQIEVHAFSDTK